MKFYERIKDCWDKLPEAEKEPILEIMAQFHFRDGKKYDDGSMGTIHISPKQFRDLLAWFKRSDDIGGE